MREPCIVKVSASTEIPNKTEIVCKYERIDLRAENWEQNSPVAPAVAWATPVKHQFAHYSKTSVKTSVLEDHANFNSRQGEDWHGLK